MIYGYIRVSSDKQKWYYFPKDFSILLMQRFFCSILG